MMKRPLLIPLGVLEAWVMELVLALLGLLLSLLSILIIWYTENKKDGTQGCLHLNNGENTFTQGVTHFYYG